VSIEFVIGIQVLILGVILFVATPAIRRRAPAYDGYVALARTAALIVGIVLIAIPFVGTATPDSNLPNPVPGTVTSVDAGASLYQANCAQCHGVDARGGGPLANTTPIQPPSLRAHLSAHSDGDLFYFISNGLPGGMPAWSGTLSETDRWNLINYLRALNDASPPPPPASSAILLPLGLPALWALVAAAFAGRSLVCRRRRR
jgi:mono/diheme cytochrome c family protein